jgi:hypothetical protein
LGDIVGHPTFKKYQVSFLLFTKFRMRIGFEPISFFQSIGLMDYIENSIINTCFDAQPAFLEEIEKTVCWPLNM